MLAHTSDFKNELKNFGREMDNIISVYDSPLLATQNDKTILTEDDMEIIAKNGGTEVAFDITGEHIYSIKLITKGVLFSTLMKELDFESDINLTVGSSLKYKFGLKVNNEYEYLDYGKFIIYKKEIDQDTGHYIYTCYDYMLKTMVKLDDRFHLPSGMLPENFNITAVIETICDILGLIVDTEVIDWEHPSGPPKPYKFAENKYRIVDIDKTNENLVTYRDLLDQICQFCGINMYMKNDELLFKNLGTPKKITVQGVDEWVLELENPTPVDTFNEDYMQDKNVLFKEKYGPINYLVVSKSETEELYAENSQSIQDNGITTYKLDNNLFLQNWNSFQDDVDNIFKTIDEVSYYQYDLTTYGLLYLEWLDYFNIEIKENTYKCLLLNSEITIKNGIEEKIYTEEEEKKTETEYVSTSKSNNDVTIETLRARKLITVGGNTVYPTVFSTQERIIGKWYNNKPLYAKTYVAHITGSGEQVDVLLNLENIDQIMFDFSHTFLYRPSSKQFVQGKGTNTSYDFMPRLFRWNNTYGYYAEFCVGSTITDTDVTFTVNYTKTTD